MTSRKPIDRLCEMLEEVGEYYKAYGNEVWWGIFVDPNTQEPIDVYSNHAQMMGGGRLLVELQFATPEQAYAATVGIRTCKGIDEQEA